MRAVLVSEFGGPEQLRPGQAADPVAGPGQVRVAVHAAGVNPVDAGNRADGGWAGLKVPCILGYDIAGVIDSLTNFVEHPEAVADRLERVSAAVGDPHRVIAGTDCGFDTSAGMGRVAADVVWAKLKALADGARLATDRLRMT